MPDAYSDQSGEPDKAYSWSFSEAVRYVLQANVCASAFIHERYDPIDKGVAYDQRREYVAQLAGTADNRPRQLFPVAARVGAVSVDGLSSPVETERESG